MIVCDENLLAQQVRVDSATDFPPEIHIRNQALKLDYWFDPGSEFYGVSECIACFAQPMKTRVPVSEKKLQKLIDRIAGQGG